MRSLRRLVTVPAAARSAIAVVCVATAILPATAVGLSFVVINQDIGTIGEYTTSGDTLNASLISGLSYPDGGLVVSGSTLFVSETGTGRIGAYTISGQTINASLISGLSTPAGIAVSGSTLFVANYANGTIGAYTTSGETINASLISGLANPLSVAVSGSTLFVSDCQAGTIGTYTISGATINASLISFGYGTCPRGLTVSGSTLFAIYDPGVNRVSTIGEYTISGEPINDPLISGLAAAWDIAVSGSDLLVTELDAGRVGAYTTSGATVNASLISGLVTPNGIAFVNNPPVAADDNAETVVNTAVTISVLGNDVDIDGDPIIVTGVTQPGNGVASLNADGTVTYTPSNGFHGTNTFTYSISDGQGGADTATVTVLVRARPNQPPIAVRDVARTSRDVAVNIDVLANDRDPDGDPIAITSVTQPAAGAVVVNANGTVTYTPAPGFRGRDSFTYDISDGNGGTAVGDVMVNVRQ